MSVNVQYLFGVISDSSSCWRVGVSAFVRESSLPWI